jgi:uncharacterized protein YndB with AHSA1/START domain
MTLETIDATTTEGAGPMATKELGNERTRVYQEGFDIVFERVFEAPRDLVWRVYTDPTHIERWWGTHGSTTEVLAMDLRPGGRWHYVSHAPDREPIGFRGDYLEVDPPSRIVRTFAVDVPDFLPGRETMTLEDLGDGRSKLTERGHFTSQADIDVHVRPPRGGDRGQRDGLTAATAT